MKINIFVYGTLRKDGIFHYYLKNCKYLGTGKAKGFDLYSDGRIPFAVKGTGKLVGELYELDVKNNKNEIENIDNLECSYIKEMTIVVLENGKDVKGFIYVYHNKLSKDVQLIKSGDFKNV